MQKKVILSVATLALGALAFGAPVAHAQSSSSVTLDCGNNYCMASASSPSSPTPFSYNWSYSGLAHMTHPLNCNGRFGGSSCTFLCYQPYEDHITMHVSVADANGALIGSASANAICNGSPI